MTYTPEQLREWPGINMRRMNTTATTRRSDE